MPASGNSELESKSPECESDGRDDLLVSANFKASQIGAECEQSQVLMLSKTLEKLVDSSSCSGLEPAQLEDCPQEWKIDKSLPPIKVRREGQSRDSSSSDLSPPSPKRMRQGSQERGDQWLGFWNPDEIK